MNLRLQLLNSNNLLNFKGLSTNSGIAICLMALVGFSLSCCFSVSSAFAQDFENGGILDQKPATPSKGSAAALTTSAEDVGNDPKSRKKRLRAERKELKSLNDKQLVKRANRGERAAQLILAARFANEAVNKSLTVISANAAMSDAAYWYSVSARRGFPGAMQVDGDLPIFPLRSIRAEN